MKPFTLFFFFACFVAIVYSECKKDCNHGDCVNDVCECHGNWGGDDCSLFDVELTVGRSHGGNVNQNQWKYYHIDVSSSDVKYVWWLNETDESADRDCDLYLMYNQYPNVYFFDQRNITGKKLSTIVMNNPKPGKYYAGVFGYTSCKYFIGVNISSSCTANCNGNGHCVDKKCVCKEGFAGTICQNRVYNLPVGSTVSAQLPDAEWRFYSTDLTIGSIVSYNLTEVNNSEGDCDMYLAFNRLPGFWNWDTSNVTKQDTSTIVYSPPKTGRYYLGVYSYTPPCMFELTLKRLENNSTCPNRCSLHGTCTHNVCRCSGGFVGDMCEWMDPYLLIGRPQEGFVGHNTWNYYNTRVITQNALAIVVEQLNEHGDCDVYVRNNEKPTAFDYDFIDLSRNKISYVTIPDPGDHSWYIGVFGWQACEYRIYLNETARCSCGEDNPHGHCNVGESQCVCDAGWSGDNCSLPVNTLSSGSKLPGSVVKYEWAYYDFDIVNSTTATISMKEKSTSGLLWLFVSFVGSPSLSDYDLCDRLTSSSIHELSIQFTEPQTRTLYIGVYGNPFNLHGTTSVPFVLVTWSAPF